MVAKVALSVSLSDTFYLKRTNCRVKGQNFRGRLITFIAGYELK